MTESLVFPYCHMSDGRWQLGLSFYIVFEGAKKSSVRSMVRIRIRRRRRLLVEILYDFSVVLSKIRNTDNCSLARDMVDMISDVLRSWAISGGILRLSACCDCCSTSKCTIVRILIKSVKPDTLSAQASTDSAHNDA